MDKNWFRFKKLMFFQRRIEQMGTDSRGFRAKHATGPTAALPARKELKCNKSFFSNYAKIPC